MRQTPKHFAQRQCKQVTKEHCTSKPNKIVKEVTNKIPREECEDSVKQICHQGNNYQFFLKKEILKKQT